MHALGPILARLDDIAGCVREKARAAGVLPAGADVSALTHEIADALTRSTSPSAPGSDASAARAVAEIAGDRPVVCLALLKEFRSAFLEALGSADLSAEETLRHVRSIDGFFDTLELDVLALAVAAPRRSAASPIKGSDALAALPMPAFIVARDGEVLFHNEAALLLSEGPGRRASADTVRLPVPMLRELAAFRVSGSTAHAAESELQTGRGARYFQMRFTTVDVEGEGDGTLVILSDLTHRRRAEEALRHSQAKYVSLFEHMATGFVLMRVVLDRRNRPVDYSIIEVNPATERLLLLKASQLVGRSASEAITLIGGVDLDWRALLAPVALTGEPTEAEVFLGSVGTWLSVSAFSPTAGHVALMLSDITAAKSGPGAQPDTRDT